MMVGSDMAVLAASLFRDNTFYDNRDDCHSFVLVSSYALQGLLQLWRTMWETEHIRPRLKTTVFNLLDCMTEALHISFERQWNNCGSYETIPWIEPLVVGCGSHRSFAALIPPALLTNLEKNIEAQLITGDDVHSQLAELKHLCIIQDASTDAAPANVAISPTRRLRPYFWPLSERSLG